MLELATEDYGSVTHLFRAEHVGAEVAGMVLAGNSQGKVFVSAQDEDQVAFIYDNGFCVLAGSIPNPEFARACLQWLYDYRHQDFFILYPSHDCWLPILEEAKSAITQKVRRVAFQLDREKFEALRSDPHLPADIRVTPINAALMRKVEATVYPWMGGTWRSAVAFEERGIGVCASTDEGVVSLCYSVFVSHGSYAIDILTIEKFRRFGLARAVAQMFVAECIQRGVQPTWDCYESNLSSMRLAQALGFRRTREFLVYSWNRQER
ncbi:GNAT family N-acetyltransferase [Ottowia thiooxydans]|uniref:GNAT family N-acetyltransferase n=1 Tax=Ottowia thiooxydans TaxID=219182 RepID=UPI00048BD505|nr:GNAT family N-acetyltransferase [Ottowia thiooxydans]